MNRKKLLKLVALLLLLGMACLVSFQLIRSTIDEFGVLHEPFMLVGIGWILIGLGIIGFIIYAIMRIYTKYFR